MNSLEREIKLKSYMNKKNKLVKRIKELKRTKSIIIESMNSPSYGGSDNSPRVVNSNISVGAASVTYKLADIDDKIMNLEQQISETNNLIYKIINHLDITSDEYSVLELKYIYSLSEYDIRDTKEISRSKYYSLLATAVSQLLEIEEVLKIVGIEGVESWWSLIMLLQT